MKASKTATRITAKAERYFSSLLTPLLCADGKFRQPATTLFVNLLRSSHANHKPKFDLSACFAKNDGDRNVWCWSDQHFCHGNIIGFCQRPFNSVQEMNNALA